MKSNYLFLHVVLITAFMFAGCATRDIAPTAVQNPPPSAPFSSFEHFEIKPIEISPPYAGQPPNEKALAKIQENLDSQLLPTLAEWNAAGNPDGRTLRIEPYVVGLKFIGGGQRFWAGALAGSSAVVIRVRYIDAETGDLIAHPEFYQRAAAMGGAWSVGGTDNAMLVRIANLISKYTVSNYPEALGGPTGG